MKIDTIVSEPYVSPNNQFIFCQEYNPYEVHEKIPPPTSDVYVYEVDKENINLVSTAVYDWIIEDIFWVPKGGGSNWYGIQKITSFSDLVFYDKGDTGKKRPKVKAKDVAEARLKALKKIT